MSTTETYVEFLYPGLLFGESSSRLLAEASGPIAMPKGAVGYRTYEQSVTTVAGETLRGTPRNHSGWTYVGRAMTVDDVRREMPDASILIANMTGNGYERVVKLPNGQTYPLKSIDQVVAAFHEDTSHG